MTSLHRLLQAKEVSALSLHTHAPSGERRAKRRVVPQRVLAARGGAAHGGGGAARGGLARGKSGPSEEHMRKRRAEFLPELLACREDELGASARRGNKAARFELACLPRSHEEVACGAQLSPGTIETMERIYCGPDAQKNQDVRLLARLGAEVVAASKNLAGSRVNLSANAYIASDQTPDDSGADLEDFVVTEQQLAEELRGQRQAPQQLDVEALEAAEQDAAVYDSEQEEAAAHESEHDSEDEQQLRGLCAAHLADICLPPESTGTNSLNRRIQTSTFTFDNAKNKLVKETVAAQLDDILQKRGNTRVYSFGAGGNEEDDDDDDGLGQAAAAAVATSAAPVAREAQRRYIRASPENKRELWGAMVDAARERGVTEDMQMNDNGTVVWDFSSIASGGAKCSGFWKAVREKAGGRVPSNRALCDYAQDWFSLVEHGNAAKRMSKMKLKF